MLADLNGIKHACKSLGVEERMAAALNFAHMPELAWPLGYPMALVAMVVSAVVPYAIFRWKKWL